MDIPAKKKQPLGLRHFVRGVCVAVVAGPTIICHLPPPPPPSGYNRLSATYETLRPGAGGGDKKIVKLDYYSTVVQFLNDMKIL
jgi:hypothetical protein